MATITELAALTKTNVTANDYLLVANAAKQTNNKFLLSSLFPTVQTKSGASGENLYVDITDKNVINLKGIESANNKITVATASNDIVLTLAESNIDLSNCDNATSAFLSTVSLTSNVTGTLPVANGGTNATSFLDKAVVVTQASGTDTLSSLAMSTNGQLLIGGTSGPQVATLTAGTNITITNGDGTITINSSLASVSSDLDMNNNDIDLGTGYVSSDGNSNGVRVTGNNAYIGAGGSYFNSAVLNLSGGIDLLTNTSHSIKVVAGTTPGTLTVQGQDTTTTNGNGGNLTLSAGDADGSGTGGQLALYGGDTGSGTGGSIKLITSVAGTYTDALTVEGSSNVAIENGDLIIREATKGLVHSNKGAVTQATDHSTGVTVNATSGIITLAGVALNAAAEAEFTVTNSTVATTSLILLTVQCPAAASAVDNATLVAQISGVSNGSFNIRLSNPGAANTSTNAHKIHFLIINQ